MTAVTRLRRGLHYFTGHDVQCSVRGTISGHWVWASVCTCARAWRGAEFDLMTAKQRAKNCGQVHDWRRCSSELAAELWPGVPVLRRSVRQIGLTEDLRGDGYVVACDGSYRASDEHAGYGFVTSAGWTKSGVLPFAETTHVNRCELRAIGEALAIYPDGSHVQVQSDSSEARSLARRILAAPVRYSDCPSWCGAYDWRLLKDAAIRRLKVEIVPVKSKLTPLHNLADHAARSGADLGVAA